MKNNENVFKSAADVVFIEAWNKLIDRSVKLRECTRLTIVKKGVLSLYPDSLDKQTAQEDLERAQFNFLSAMVDYDLMMDEVSRCYDRNKADLSYCLGWGPERWKTSHELVEEVYENFFKKS